MRIISNFQDYYDSIQQYGIDNKIVFNRINEHQCKFNTEPSIWHLSTSQKDLDLRYKPYLNLKIENDCLDFKLIDRLQTFFDEYSFPYNLHKIVTVINGKAYQNYVLTLDKTMDNGYVEKIISKNVDSKMLFDLVKSNIDKLHSNSHPYLVKHFERFKNYEQFVNWKDRFYTPKDSSYTTEEKLKELHIELKNPIFFIIGKDEKDVLVNVPLSYLGFNHLFDGNIEIMAQEISYCIGNVLNNNNEPPIAIDNNGKIQQYGFDKKISFRHRK